MNWASKQKPNTELRIPKEHRTPNSERPSAPSMVLFGIRYSDFFRISDFGFRICLLLLALLLCVSCATPKAPPPLSRFEFEQPQMGIPFRIVLYAPDAATAEKAANAAYARVRALNAILSDYEDDSELVKVTQSAGQGRGVQVSEDLWRVLERSQRIAVASDGAFDVTAGPCISLWRRARRIGRMPEPEKMVAALSATGHDKMRLDARTHTVELLVPKMRLDLGGIAKGYAVDQALAVLAAQGIHSALVAGSGDMAVSDPPPGKPGWRIELGGFDATNAPAARFVLLRHQALATSGDLYQRVELDGKRYSHIVDPHTGLGLTDHALVNIIAPDCTTADALATTVCVLGPAKGLRLVESTPGVAALITRQPGAKIEQYASRRLGHFLVKPGQ
jgi:thiamine biosynthesis lipoprotein